MSTGRGTTDLRSAGVEYAALRESLSDLVRSLAPHELATPVASCPGWTVHDTIAHLAGVAADVVNGVHPIGSLDDWTAVQVADRVNTATAVVLREWERSSSQLEMLLDRDDTSLPANLLDLAVHDDDIRAAVERPRTGPSPVHDALAPAMARRFLAAIERAGAAPVAIVSPGGEPWAGASGAPVTIGMSPYVLARAAFGRRSRHQIESCFAGAPDPSPYIDLLCVFPPSSADLVD